MAELFVTMGDITTLEVDAIVNAANSALIPGGGVDGAIHRAAGPELARAVAEHGSCPTGEAVLTDAFALPARWVIHTVGPVWHGGRDGEPQLLASCYRGSLELATEVGATSIAFPAISTGIYGYPLEPAAEIAVDTVRANLAAPVETVHFVCFDEMATRVYEDALRA
jgi:O-acetyl-ADP-ribose deacetylase (regulator of RNase III)